jgi:TonB family protein
MLVAVQRIAQGSYDAIVVDWDQEADAIFLLKSVREQKNTNQALNLALVQNDKDLPRALQHGANSVIRKPIDLRQAKDTLSTARDLILSRLSEQRSKEERVAAEQAALTAAAAELQDEVDTPAPKTGFVAQTAPRSALEAAESTVKQNTPGESSSWHATQAGTRAQELAPDPIEAQPVKKKRWDEKPQADERPSAQEMSSLEVAARGISSSQDFTGIFSSLPEERESQPRPDGRSNRRYLVFAVVSCLLAAAVFWVWAPGGSYRSVLNSLIHSSSRPAQTAAPQPTVKSSPVQPVSLEQVAPTPPPAPSTPEQGFAPTEPGPIESSETDPSDLEVIETKAIPRPGAQQPPSTVAPGDPVQSPAEPVPTADTPPTAVVPVAQPQNPAAAPVREKSIPASAGRTGVIIPDSLRTTPSQAPASSLDSGVLPEETSRNLLEHRVEPVYPAQGLPHHLEGSVVLHVWVAKDGTVQDVKLIRGNFALGRAAFDAVRQWRFRPYAPHNRSIDFQTVVTLNFKYPG